MKLEKTNTKKFSEIMDGLYNRMADAILLCLFFGISIGCSSYVWFNMPSIDLQILLGFIALIFSLGFAYAGNITFNDIEKKKNQNTLLATVKTGYFWLGAIHLSVFIIYTCASGYPSGWLFKIFFLILMGVGNQAMIRYQRQPQYIPIKKYRDEAA